MSQIAKMPARALGRSERPTPLGHDEQMEAERVARRLTDEFRGLIGLLPAADRSASGMARTLEVDRATCQRLVSACRHGGGAYTLVEVPGVEGLTLFVDAIARRLEGLGAEERLAAARAAIDNFQELIERLAGSQRRLRARLEAEAGGDKQTAMHVHGGSDDEANREAMFRAAAAVTGRWSESLVYVSVVRPVPGRPDYTEAQGARGLIGHHATPDAVPLEVGHSAPLSERSSVAPVDSLLIEPFCSHPLPRLVSRSGGQVVAHVLDTPPTADDAAHDIVLSRRTRVPDRHPATLKPAIGEVWNLVNFPARRMVFDVYLHRDIARRCIPSLELHLWSADMASHARARWSTRFAGGPKLELLGPGVRRAASQAYRRHAELTKAMFEEVGWEPDEFIGYRCETAFPLWRAGYCMAFDFTGGDAATGQG